MVVIKLKLDTTYKQIEEHKNGIIYDLGVGT